VTAYIVRRLLQTVVVLFVLSFVTYGLMGLMPGDPLDIACAANPRCTMENLDEMKKNLGLSLGMWNSQTVLLALIRKGLTREAAYKLVQDAAMSTWAVKHAGRDDAVRAEHADREIGDVHRTALAAVGAGRASEQLAHHALDRCALGDRVAVAAMRRGEQVLDAQMRAHPRGNRLLAGGQVQGAAHIRFREARAEGRHAALGGLLGGVFEGADARHGSIQRKRLRKSDRGAGHMRCSRRDGPASQPNRPVM